MSFKIALGVKVREKITGLTGIITSRTQFLNGCNRYGIEQPLDKDGKIPEVLAFDEARIEVIDKVAFTAMTEEAKTAAPGGPRAPLPRER